MTQSPSNTLTGRISKDVTLTGDVVLDAAVFVDVSFQSARLIYSGGQPPSFQNCRFDNATFAFEGPASNTLSFINAMAPANTGMRDIAMGLLPAMKP